MPDVFDAVAEKKDIFDKVAPDKEGDIFDKVAPTPQPSILDTVKSAIKQHIANPPAILDQVKDSDIDINAMLNRLPSAIRAARIKQNVGLAPQPTGFIDKITSPIHPGFTPASSRLPEDIARVQNPQSVGEAIQNVANNLLEFGANTRLGQATTATLAAPALLAETPVAAPAAALAKLLTIPFGLNALRDLPAGIKREANAPTFLLALQEALNNIVNVGVAHGGTQGLVVPRGLFYNPTTTIKSSPAIAMGKASTQIPATGAQQDANPKQITVGMAGQAPTRPSGEVAEGKPSVPSQSSEARLQPQAPTKVTFNFPKQRVQETETATKGTPSAPTAAASGQPVPLLGNLKQAIVKDKIANGEPVNRMQALGNEQMLQEAGYQQVGTGWEKPVETRPVDAPQSRDVAVPGTTLPQPADNIPQTPKLEQTPPTIPKIGKVEGERGSASLPDKPDIRVGSFRFLPVAQDPKAIQTKMGLISTDYLKSKMNPTDTELMKPVFESLGNPKFIHPKELQKAIQEHGPKVEVKKFTKEGRPEQDPKWEAMENERFDIRHRLDTKGYSQQLSPLSLINDSTVPQDVRQLASRLHELDSELSNRSTQPHEGSHWSSIAPKPESQMKDYAEIAVTKSVKEKDANIDRYGGNFGTQEYRESKGYQFPSSHSFPPNTLGFSRGYMETLPDGRKVWHVIEVQSDWAQDVRNRQEEVDSQRSQQEPLLDERKNLVEKASDPLLKHHQQLVLKATIDHARSLGADAIALSDAETAMMTEGHDAYAGITRALRQAELTGSGEVTSGGEIPQEGGMRLNYSQILPRILKDLTGSEGEKVSFGEHKNAFVERYNEPDREAREDALYRHQAGALPAEDFEPSLGKHKEPRKDLIFKNPDGSPKTDASGLLFHLDKVDPSKFTLTGRDRLGMAELPDEPTESKFPILPTRPQEKAPTPAAGATSGEAPPMAVPRASEGGAATPRALRDLNPQDLSKLGLQPGEYTSTRLRMAYLNKARQLHPDVTQGDSKPFQELQEAYKRLTSGESLDKRLQAGGALTFLQDNEPLTPSQYNKLADLATPRQLDRLVGKRPDVSFYYDNSTGKMKVSVGDTTFDKPVSAALLSELRTAKPARQVADELALHPDDPTERAIAQFVEKYGNRKDDTLGFNLRRYADYKKLLPSQRNAPNAFSQEKLINYLSSHAANQAKRMPSAMKAELLADIEREKASDTTTSGGRPVAEAATGGASSGIPAGEAPSSLKRDSQRGSTELPDKPEEERYYKTPTGVRIHDYAIQDWSSEMGPGFERVPSLIHVETPSKLRRQGLAKQAILDWINEQEELGYKYVALTNTISPEGAKLVSSLERSGAIKHYDGYIFTIDKLSRDSQSGMAELPDKPEEDFPKLVFAHQQDKPLSDAIDHIAQGKKLAKGKKGIDETLRGVVNSIALESMPYTTAANRVAGEKLMNMLAAPMFGDEKAVIVNLRIALGNKALADKVAEAVALDELGTIAEREGRNYDAAVERYGKTIKSGDELRKLFEEKDTDFSRALERRGAIWEAEMQPIAKIAFDDPELQTPRGKLSGQRSNLLRLREEEEVGDPTFGKPRKSATPTKGGLFKRAKGQAGEYSFDSHDTMSYSFSQQQRHAAYREYIEELIKGGDAVPSTEGHPVHTVKGQPATGMPYKRAGTDFDTLYVRNDLLKELKVATNPIESPPAAFKAANSLANALAVAAINEASFHAGNITLGLMSLPLGTSKLGLIGSAVAKAALRSDIPIKVAKAMFETRSPEQQVEIARIGAERPAMKSQAASLGPVLKVLDNKLRHTLADWFDKAADNGLVERTETNKREFINQLGQYILRAQGYFRRQARTTQVGSFATGGTTFGQHVVRQAFLADPRVKATSALGAGLLRADQVAGTVGNLLALGTLTYLITGSLLPPPNVRFGDIPVGKRKDGTYKTVPFLDLFGTGRALKKTGLQDIIEAKRLGLDSNTAYGSAASDIINALVNPFAGPLTKVVSGTMLGTTDLGHPTLRRYPVTPEGGFEQKWSDFKNAIADVSVVTGIPMDFIDEEKRKEMEEGWEDIKAGKYSEAAEKLEPAAKRAFARFTPSKSLRLSIAENLPKIVKAGDTKQYVQDIAKRARRLPVAEREDFLNRAIQRIKDSDSRDWAEREIFRRLRKSIFNDESAPPETATNNKTTASPAQEGASRYSAFDEP